MQGNGAKSAALVNTDLTAAYTEHSQSQLCPNACLINWIFVVLSSGKTGSAVLPESEGGFFLSIVPKDSWVSLTYLTRHNQCCLVRPKPQFSKYAVMGQFSSRVFLVFVAKGGSGSPPWLTLSQDNLQSMPATIAACKQHRAQMPVDACSPQQVKIVGLMNKHCEQTSNRVDLHMRPSAFCSERTWSHQGDQETESDMGRSQFYTVVHAS